MSTPTSAFSSGWRYILYCSFVDSREVIAKSCQTSYPPPKKQKHDEQEDTMRMGWRCHKTESISISKNKSNSKEKATAIQSYTKIKATMRTIASIFAALLPAAAVAFIPAPQHSVTTILRATTPEMIGDVDISHAHYCTDHFGECSLEEMELARDGKYSDSSLCRIR